MEIPSARVSLLVIRSSDIDRTAEFYTKLGLTFEKHTHGKGPEHYASEVDGFVFEIYPLSKSGIATTETRIGFEVQSVDETVRLLEDAGAKIITRPKDSEWGQRAVVKDFEGHTIELTPLKRLPTIEAPSHD